MPDLRMPEINEVRIAGNFVDDPEIKKVGRDSTLVNFRLAVNRRYRGSDGQKKEETMFIRCTGWGTIAEWIAKDYTKGDPAYITGRLKMNEFTDKDGKKVVTHEIVIDRIQALAWTNDRPMPTENKQRRDPSPDVPDDDDAPF